MTCTAVGGAVEPYVFMSGSPAVDPMPGIPGDARDRDPGEPDPDAMPAGPSGPAQPGVITAAVTAITRAGTAARRAKDAAAPRRRTGRSVSDGCASSTAHPVISANSRTVLTTSRPPNGSGRPLSGPIGRPVVRDATYTARMMAFPVRPSHSQGRDGRHSTTAAQISCAQEMTRKNTPYRAYWVKCPKMTVKWIAAAPADSEARPPRRYGLAVAGAARIPRSVNTGALMAAC